MKVKVHGGGQTDSSGAMGGNEDAPEALVKHRSEQRLARFAAAVMCGDRVAVQRPRRAAILPQQLGTAGALSDPSNTFAPAKLTSWGLTWPQIEARFEH